MLLLVQGLAVHATVAEYSNHNKDRKKVHAVSTLQLQLSNEPDTFDPNLTSSSQWVEVELIHLRTTSLIDASLPRIVYRLLLSNQNLPPRLYLI